MDKTVIFGTCQELPLVFKQASVQAKINFMIVHTSTSTGGGLRGLKPPILILEGAKPLHF